MSIRSRLAGVVRPLSGPRGRAAEVRRRRFAEHADLEAALSTVRDALAGVTVTRRRLEQLKTAMDEHADVRRQEAGNAVAMGRDDLARVALRYRARLGRAQAEVGECWQELTAQQAVLTERSRYLQTELERLRERRDEASARPESLGAANTRAEAGEAETAARDGVEDAVDQASAVLARATRCAAAVDALIAADDLDATRASPGAEAEPDLDAEQADAELARLHAEFASAGSDDPAAGGPGDQPPDEGPREPAPGTSS